MGDMGYVISISLFLLLVGLVLKCQLCKATILTRVKSRLLNGIVSEVSNGTEITKTWTVRYNTYQMSLHFTIWVHFVHRNNTKVPEN